MREYFFDFVHASSAKEGKSCRNARRPDTASHTVYQISLHFAIKGAYELPNSPGMGRPKVILIEGNPQNAPGISQVSQIRFVRFRVSDADHGVGLLWFCQSFDRLAAEDPDVAAMCPDVAAMCVVWHFLDRLPFHFFRPDSFTWVGAPV